MSLFRKPRRRMQVRSLAQHDDDEESPPPPPPPAAPQQPAASRAAKHTQALLSFGDEGRSSLSLSLSLSLPLPPSFIGYAPLVTRTTRTTRIHDKTIVSVKF